MRLETALRHWAVDGVDTVQLREKGLNTGELFALASAAMAFLRQLPEDRTRPRLLVNSRLDVALASGADGVHLPAGAGPLRPGQVRSAFSAVGRPDCLVSLSCHTIEEVSRAREGGANLVLFGPVFEKRVAGQLLVAGQGLPFLREACQAAGPLPVLALGGVTPAQWEACRAVGAAGFASIRAFA